MTDSSILACNPAGCEQVNSRRQDTDGRSNDGLTPMLARWIRRRVFNRLQHLQQGRITFTDEDGTVELGRLATDGLSAALNVHDSRFYGRVAMAGNLGFAESYLLNEWSTDDLISLLQIFARNLDHLEKSDRMGMNIGRTIATARHRLARNSRNGSRRNIARHYDLSNDFFATFLDPTMMYSSAKFEAPDLSLEQASIAKLEAVCRKLDLQQGDRVVEIGTGWGGFAVHAAGNYGCHVTTTTISRQQYEFAQKRIADAGLTDRVDLLLNDYRDLSGKYDKLVSIEMIEAVGHEYYDTYFAVCDRLLKPGGRMVMQSITIPEQRYRRYIRSVDFIQKYIFPGGCLPSLSEIQQAVGRTGDLRLVGQEDFGYCYARTLREWRTRFFDRINDVRRLGFDERFIRMWEFYLCYCEAAFLERAVGVSQLEWIKAGRIGT